MSDKLILIFFTVAWYIVLNRAINFILPGFFSSLGIIQIAVLVVLIIPSIFFAKKTADYLKG